MRRWLLFAPLLWSCSRDERACAEDTAGGAITVEDVGCEASPAAELALPETEVDFGYAAPGEVVTRSVELSNVGPFPLGISALTIGDHTEDFDVTYDLAATACAWEPDAPYADNHAFVLEPGCAIPVTVTYAALTPGEVWDALVIDSDALADPATAGFQGDLIHARDVVWLRGVTDGPPAVDTDPYVAGNVIWTEQTAVIEGETIRAAVRVFDPDGDAITYSWSTDDGDAAFVDPTLPEVELTAPEVGARVASGEDLNLYCVIIDDDGDQDWAFGRIAVWREGEPLYGECPEPAVGSGGCSGASGTGGWGAGGEGTGCGEPACADPGCGGEPAFLLLLGAFGLSRRRRGT